MMKTATRSISWIATWWIAANLGAQDLRKPTPPAPVEVPSQPATGAPAKPPVRLSEIIRYKGRPGRDPGGKDRTVTAASRAEGQPDLKLVALSPGGSATTLLSTPTLWWYQSLPTAHGELQLSLSKLDTKRPETLLTARLPAKAAGFQSVSLAHPDVNPRLRKLEPGVTYQWSLSLIGKDRKSSVYTRITLDPHPEVEKALRENSAAAETFGALSESGNWHELFDHVASLARDHPEEGSLVKARDSLLEQTGLSRMIGKP